MNRGRPMRIDSLNRSWVKLALLNIVISVSVSLIVFLSFGKSVKQSDTKELQNQVTVLHQEISKVSLLDWSFFKSKYLYGNITIVLGLPLHKSKGGFIWERITKNAKWVFRKKFNWSNKNFHSKLTFNIHFTKSWPKFN